MNKCMHCEAKLSDCNKSGVCKLHINYKLNKKCLKCQCIIYDKNVNSYCNKHRDRSGKNNPMYGKTIYQQWVENYGIEEANIRKQSFKEKHIQATKLMWENNDYREKVIKNATGLKRADSFRETQKINATKQMLDKNQRELRSKAIKISWEKGTHSPDHLNSHNKYGIRGFTEDGIFYASNIEKERIYYFKSKNLNWKRYAVNDFEWRINYEFNGKKSLYLPDFIIYFENKIIIEEMKYDINRLSNQENAKIMAASLFLPTVGIEYRVNDDPIKPL